MIRNVFKIEFQLTSGLSVGKGDSLETDCDVITRRDGTPFIPGSSIAGVYRELVSEKLLADYSRQGDSAASDSEKITSESPEKEVDRYFGRVNINSEVEDQKETDKGRPSRIIVYDANVIRNGNRPGYIISERDNVALDDFKTAKAGAKFDREIVNAGTKFVTYFEETPEDEGSPKNSMSKYARLILKAWESGELRFGSKTSRGLGAVRLLGVSWKSFCLPEDADGWAEFNMYDADVWKKSSIYDSHTGWNAEKAENPGQTENEAAVADTRIRIRLDLKQQGGISIRQYSTDVGEPDFVQLENVDPSLPEPTEKASEKNDLSNFVPVIPGSSWAGAFRHRMKELHPESGREEELDWLFGCVDANTNRKEKSRILFSESQITGFVRLTMTRNAIDRFTGGTVDGALYTERTVYNGNCILSIELPRETNKNLKRALAASLADLHEGFLAVGGETAIGRGLFRITGINGNKPEFCKDTPEGETIYKELTSLMGAADA